MNSDGPEFPDQVAKNKSEEQESSSFAEGLIGKILLPFILVSVMLAILVPHLSKK